MRTALCLIALAIMADKHVDTTTGWFTILAIAFSIFLDVIDFLLGIQNA